MLKLPIKIAAHLIARLMSMQRSGNFIGFSPCSRRMGANTTHHGARNENQNAVLHNKMNTHQDDQHTLPSHAKVASVRKVPTYGKHGNSHFSSLQTAG